MRANSKELRLRVLATIEGRMPTAKVKPQNAEIVAVGAHEDVKVSIGDVVILCKYVGTEVKLDSDEHRIVEAEDIFGVVEA